MCATRNLTTKGGRTHLRLEVSEELDKEREVRQLVQASLVTQTPEPLLDAADLSVQVRPELGQAPPDAVAEFPAERLQEEGTARSAADAEELQVLLEERHFLL